MLIERITNNGLVRIDSLKPGDCLEHDGSIYMVTNGSQRIKDCNKKIQVVNYNGSESYFSCESTMVKHLPKAKWVC